MNPIIGGSSSTIMNPKRSMYLSPDWHHFIKRKPRPKKKKEKNNPHYARNPSGGSMKWLLLGGAAFLFLTPQGRALTSQVTGSAMPAGGYPAGTVRLADGRYRLPSGQIIGTPTNNIAPGWLAPFASMVPGITSGLTSWIRGWGTDESPAQSSDGGGSATGTPDILSSRWMYGDPLPVIPDLTLPPTGPEWDLSSWWGNMESQAAAEAGLLSIGPVPMLSFGGESWVTPLEEIPPLWNEADYVGFSGPRGYRGYRLPPSVR